MNSPALGSTVICAVTGKSFVIARDGCSFNYATRHSDGAIISDEGVDIAERRELLDRTKPFSCYLSSDGKTVGGWKGNRLGDVLAIRSVNSGRHFTDLNSVIVRDVHGGFWWGRGQRGMHITLRPRKKGV